jgi:hypothetical protein
MIMEVLGGGARMKFSALAANKIGLSGAGRTGDARATPENEILDYPYVDSTMSHPIVRMLSVAVLHPTNKKDEHKRQSTIDHVNLVRRRTQNGS